MICYPSAHEGEDGRKPKRATHAGLSRATVCQHHTFSWIQGTSMMEEAKNQGLQLQVNCEASEGQKKPENWKLKQSSQVGRGWVGRASSSDARGLGFEPRPLRFKKYHFFTPKPKGSPRSRAHPRISELSVRGRGQAEKRSQFEPVLMTPGPTLIEFCIFHRLWSVFQLYDFLDFKLTTCYRYTYFYSFPQDTARTFCS